jgi:hypothetical protein
MQSRQIAIIAVATLVAFGAAFGVGKATNKSEASPASDGGVKSIEVAAAPAVGSVVTGGVLPALKATKKKATKKKVAKPATSSGSATPVQRPSQTTTQTQQQTPVRTAQPPAKAKPKPTPVSGDTGGGED